MWLQVGRDFTNWIKDRIKDYGFVEGRDFVLTLAKTGERKNVVVHEYHITLDMAKELSMVERNEKGKEARLYFIDCEKKLKAELLGKADPAEPKVARGAKVDIPALAHSFEASYKVLTKVIRLPHSQAVIGADRAGLASYGASLLKLTGVAESFKAETQAPLLIPAEIGNVFQVTASAINLLLEKLGLQTKYRDGNDKLRWRLTDKGIALGGEYHCVGVEGKKTTVTQIKWADSILQYLEDQLNGNPVDA
jgi:phage anti-repressor protein